MPTIEIRTLDSFREKWIGVSMDKMTSYFEFCINERKGGFLQEHEYQEWADRIDYYQKDGRSKAYRLKVVAGVCRSIYKNGFDFHFIPNVLMDGSVVSGRHRICIAKALGVTHIPVLLVNEVADHHATDAQLETFYQTVAWQEYRASDSYKLLVRKRR